MSFLHELKAKTKLSEGIEAPVAVSTTKSRGSAPGREWAKIKCPRCEIMVFEWDYESHKTAHSSEITPYLYLGGERNAGNLKELTVRTNINRVLNVAWEVSNFYPEQFHYRNVAIADDGVTDITTFLDSCFDFIEDAASSGERVLVHCVQGMSRSATVVIAYLMKKHKWTLSEALDYVKERRSCVNPHVGFMAQLRKYEAALFEAEDDTLVLDGGEVIHTRMPTDAEVEAAMGGFPSGTAADRIDGMVQLSTDQPVVATVGESPLSAVDEAILEAASHVLQAQSGEVTSGPLPELSEPVVATYD